MALLGFHLPAAPGWVAIAVSYLLGSTAFGLILGLLRGVDIREHGSCNVGATNAGRVLGRPFGLAAFAGDFLKGWAPTFWLAPWLASSPEAVDSLAVLCGSAAVLGHVWPLYFGFKGGKGVATGCGAVFGIDPWLFLGAGAVWLVTLGLTRFVGLSSLMMGFAFPAFAWWRMVSQDTDATVLVGTIALALLVLVRHRANIARMLAGTEPRMGKKRAPSSSEASGTET